MGGPSNCRIVLGLCIAGLVIPHGYGFFIVTTRETTRKAAHPFPRRGDSLLGNEKTKSTPRSGLTSRQSTTLRLSRNDPDHISRDSPLSRIKAKVSSENARKFSILMSLAGASLGPFLDSYHSAFGVLQYDSPIQLTLWASSDSHPALITCWWVPLLFGFAGWLIGWLYILYDAIFTVPTSSSQPSVTKILLGISVFTFQYWLSGLLFAAGFDRSLIFNVMSGLAAAGFVALDRTESGLIVSASTAIGGPLIEAVLLSMAKMGSMGEFGYHYTDLGETGFFPLWIAPVYFLGGPAVGNLARGVWNALETSETDSKTVSAASTPCQDCSDTRQVPCPNCDGVGTYVAMGNRMVTCTSCRGRGFVICRACFERYGDDPYDIDAIRELMSRMPD
jgi:hypothetical protein